MRCGSRWGWSSTSLVVRRLLRASRTTVGHSVRPAPRVHKCVRFDGESTPLTAFAHADYYAISALCAELTFPWGAK